MLRRSTFVVVAALCVASCGGGSTPSSTSAAAKPDAPWFEERAVASGIDFVHFNGMSGEYYYPEIMAPGVGLFDYDNDGDLDVYLVQSQMLGKKTVKDALFPPKGPLTDRLYRNDLTVAADGSRTLHFTDVTDQAGIDIDTCRIVTAHVGVIGPGGEVLEQRQWLVDPGVEIPTAATLIHGVTTERARLEGLPAVQGVVEIIYTLGYYGLVAMLLNADEHPLPEGVEPELEPLAD